MNRNSFTHRSKKQLNTPSHFFRSQQQWIGQETTAETPAQETATQRTVSRKESKEKENRNIVVGSKSPVELMQDILRMVGDGQENWVYYSKEAE